jgi:hypothetical protein
LDWSALCLRSLLLAVGVVVYETESGEGGTAGFLLEGPPSAAHPTTAKPSVTMQAEQSTYPLVKGGWQTRVDHHLQC